MQQTLAGLLFENHSLFRDGVNKHPLACGADSKFFIKRRMVPVSSASKFFYKLFVSCVERAGLAHPAQCFRMSRVAATGPMPGQNIPQAVKLAMFRKQMLPTQMFRMYVPQAHNGYSSFPIGNSYVYIGIAYGVTVLSLNTNHSLINCSNSLKSAK